MKIQGLDHYNLRASREMLDQLCSFYCEVLGLSLGDRPPFTEFGFWLYAGNQAVLHLSEAGENEIHSVETATRFGHAAFACTDRMGFERRLSEHGIHYEVARVPESGPFQLFLQDPAGNGVELSFDAEEA